ncbi:hypothetical protein AQUCO_00100290v1 [Aquilegia coerulea]|uniref:Mitochondrial pyruvate carrier n=1 Tax=Aquilegia coerulea TaxID=218851 RepID=A0A2G5F9Q8_AQUCA|nr:hypothetical protein AQUCO_00100290v1 [Aquilegia coerulea]
MYDVLLKRNREYSPPLEPFPYKMVWEGLVDTQKPPELISANMIGLLCVYSALFMRFAWMVQPRNYLFLASHATNETVQLYQFSRWAKTQG